MQLEKSLFGLSFGEKLYLADIIDIIIASSVKDIKTNGKCSIAHSSAVFFMLARLPLLSGALIKNI